MASFRNPVDISNRALQWCGAKRISDTLGFTETSRNASECQFVYDKLRRAELRDNLWRFSTRKVVLRPIDPNTTFLVAPAMWSSTTSYFSGAIVSDATNTLWISNFPDNKGNAPGSSYFWDLYIGPMTVHKWDSKTAYFSGELVYTAPGDGTFRVFFSFQNNNSDNPNVPTQWAATSTYVKDQVVQFFPAWAGGTVYAAGATVTYADGNTYSSLSAGNVGNTPSSSPTFWALMPQTGAATTAAILPWDSTVTYSIGGFVDVNGTQYVSLTANNLNLAPATHAANWAALTGGVAYASLIDTNIGNEPDLSPPLWAVGVTYAINAQVIASDGNIYTSTGNGNVGHDPTTDGGVHWTNTNVLGPWTSVLNFGSGGSMKWLSIGPVALTDFFMPYPIGSGPVTQTTTRNLFRLPANFLRRAPQDPKAGSSSPLGSPSGLVYPDWIYEGDYLISAETQPIIFRFVADIYDVTAMDDMFCEALAARIGLAVCEPITQSTSKLQMIGQQYTHWINQAKRTNGIDIEPIEPPMDDFIACRL